jgi:uncharacterized protein (TIGR02145 family)
MKNFKKLLTALIYAIALNPVFAQTPSQFNYQAVLRNAEGAPIANQVTSVKVEILQGSPTGTVVFNETHSVTTSNLGLINLQIGSLENGLGNIEWGTSSHFVRISVNDVEFGTSQLLSVPYAMHAKTFDGDMQGREIENIADPTSNQSAASKAYVDVLKNRIDAMEELLLTHFGITDIEGNNYPVVKIGNQYWMAENLKTLAYNDGEAIPLIEFDLDYNPNPAGYRIYDNIESNKDLYGVLYNWQVVETEKICPIGWHVPSFDEFYELIDFVGGVSVAGGKLKSKAMVPNAHPRWESPNTGATNEFGFAALPGGVVYSSTDTNDLYFDGQGYRGQYWTTRVYNEYNSYLIEFTYDSQSVPSTILSSKNVGRSIRCIKD